MRKRTGMIIAVMAMTALTVTTVFAGDMGGGRGQGGPGGGGQQMQQDQTHIAMAEQPTTPPASAACPAMQWPVMLALCPLRMMSPVRGMMMFKHKALPWLCVIAMTAAAVMLDISPTRYILEKSRSRYILIVSC